MEDKEVIGFGSLCDISRGENCVEIHIGTGCFWVYAQPGDKNEFSITVSLEEDMEAEGDGTVVFKYIIHLTDKEYAAALDSSFEDFLFQDNVDSLVAQRVAKGLFGFIIRSLNKPRYYGEDSFTIPDKTIVSWEKYAKDLIRKRMRGELISEYIPGYEPK